MVRRALLIVLSTAVLALPAGAAALETTKLSNEQTITRWAYTNDIVSVWTKPFKSGNKITRLRWNNEDGLPELYVALSSVMDEKGQEWVKIRLPKRPNGQVGWIPRQGIGAYHVVRTHLRINRSTFKATLYKRGKKIFSARIGVGKDATPTPAGHFYIREKLTGFGSGGPYGPLAFGTSAYSSLSDWPGGGIIGIHGTNQPGLLPGKVSHGCIRLRNGDILRLSRKMPLGTPIEIL